MVFANLVGLSRCILLKLMRFNGSFSFRNVLKFVASCVVFLGSWPVFFPTNAERVYLLASFTGLFTFCRCTIFIKITFFAKGLPRSFCLNGNETDWKVGAITWTRNETVVKNREIKSHVYGKRQTSFSSWEFLKIENKQIKTVQNNSYVWNWLETTYFWVEVTSS